MIRSLVHNVEAEIRAALAASRSPFLLTPEQTPGGSGSVVSTAGTAYVKYAGRWPVAIAAIDVLLYVHGVAAAGVGWAEAAAYTSPDLNRTNFDTNSESIPLTVCGYTDIEAEVKTAATVGYWKRVTLTNPIPPDTEIWVGFASSFASTQASFRIPSEHSIMGIGKTLADATGATTRPSLNIGTARTFGGAVGAGVTVPVTGALVVPAS